MDEKAAGGSANDLGFELGGTPALRKCMTCQYLATSVDVEMSYSVRPATGRKNYYGSGAEWSAELAAMLFSALQTIILRAINLRHWLTVYLTACAENGGKPPTDLTPFMPWAMDEARLCELKQPLKQAPNRLTHSPDTS